MKQGRHGNAAPPHRAPLHACSNITYVVTCFLHAVRPAGHHSCSLEPSYLKLNISKLVVDGKLE